MSQSPISAAARLRLENDNTVLLIIDVQERLGAAMPEQQLEAVIKNTGVLQEAAKSLDFPVITTEQYPRGLGPTVQPIRDALREHEAPVEKVCFSCVAVDEVKQRLDTLNRKQVLVVGMETHVCVFQTVRDLIEHGYTPFVLADATSSRTAENHNLGLSLVREAGAVISSTEAVLFDLLKQAGTPEFKHLSRLIK